MEESTYQTLLEMATNMKQELGVVQEELCRYIHRKANGYSDDLMDSKQLMAYLHISKRKLTYMRKKGQIPYYEMAGKIYYKKAEIDALFVKTSAFFENK